MITLDKVEFSYSSALEGFSLGPIDFIVEPGKIYGWKGHNGSGKSTLASILAGEKTPQQGKVTGRPKASFLFAQRIAENVFPELSVAQHLQLFRNSEDRERILQTFPVLQKRTKNYPDELSGGELQRLAFSMAFARPCQLYIWDEVTNHLDSKAKHAVGAMVRDWVSASSDRYSIFISHDDDFHRQFSDEITLFDEGKILESKFNHAIAGSIHE